jgi:hypothetical protein
MELFQNISINEIRAFWFVRKLGFKGFEGRPCPPFCATFRFCYGLKPMTV